MRQVDVLPAGIVVGLRFCSGLVAWPVPPVEVEGHASSRQGGVARRGVDTKGRDATRARDATRSSAGSAVARNPAGSRASGSLQGAVAFRAGGGDDQGGEDREGKRGTTESA